MSTHVQDIIVYLLVAGAAFYVARAFWLSMRGNAGCGGCGTKGGCGKVGANNDMARGMSTHAGDSSNGLIQISINISGETRAKRE